MTKVNNYNIPVSGEDFAKALKEYNSPVANRTVGMEMECFVVKQDGSLTDPATHDMLYLLLRRVLGDKASIEPGAHMMEIKTGVHDNADDMADELSRNLARLREEAESLGLKILDSSDIPGYSEAELSLNIVSPVDPETGSKRRQNEAFKAYKQLGHEEIGEHGCGTISIQLTHSVKDADVLHRWSRVHAALLPLYYAVFENRTRDNGVHQAMRSRRALGVQGMITPYVFAAKDGDDFVDRYVESAKRTKLVSALDENGENYVLSVPSTFTGLSSNQQTLGNLLQAASMSWNACKIKPIFNEVALADGKIELSNLLLEVRDIDSSDKAIEAVSGWLCALTQSDDRLLEAETYLESFGIPVCSDPLKAQKIIEDTLLKIENEQAYLDVPYGRRGAVLGDVLWGFVIPTLQRTRSDHDVVEIWREAAQANSSVFNVSHETYRKKSKNGREFDGPSLDI